MKWVLIIIVLNGGPTAVDHVEFATQQLCDQARVDLKVIPGVIGTCEVLR